MPTTTWLASRLLLTLSPRDKTSFRGILADAASKRPPQIATFVVYNLPNRDCSARASAGEFCCRKYRDGTCNYVDSTDCRAGLAQYRVNYIDVIARVVRSFCTRVPMAFIIEPDSLPNLVTNLANPKCSAAGTQKSYREGIKYAVDKLHAACNRATLYVDAGHGGWLGWDDGATKFAKEIAALRISNKIRGFATNVAGYQSLGTRCPMLGFCNGGANAMHPCCRDDPCSLTMQYNPSFTELNYVRQISQKMAAKVPGFRPKFVIDTSRNGVKDSRSKCSNFCNIRGAGLGLLPSVNTDSPDLIDAYLWIKTPGESDGCTKILPNGNKCKRFEEACASRDSIGTRRGEPRVPDAGKWFRYHIKRLARRANLR